MVLGLEGLVLVLVLVLGCLVLVLEGQVLVNITVPNTDEPIPPLPKYVTECSYIIAYNIYEFSLQA